MLAAAERGGGTCCRRTSGRMICSHSSSTSTSSTSTCRRRLAQHRPRLLSVAASSSSSTSSSSRPPRDPPPGAPGGEAPLRLAQQAAQQLKEQNDQQASLIKQLKEQNELLMRMYQQSQANAELLLGQLVRLQEQLVPPPAEAEQQPQQPSVISEPAAPPAAAETTIQRPLPPPAVTTAAAAAAAPRPRAAAPQRPPMSPQEAATALLELFLSAQQQEAAAFPDDDALAALCDPQLQFLGQGASPCQLLKAPRQRRELLVAAAALQSRPGGSQRRQPLLDAMAPARQLLALVAQHVQEEAAPAALPAQEGVATLVALTTLRLPVRPDWLAALLKHLNGLSSTASSSSKTSSKRGGSSSSGSGSRSGTWFAAPAEAVQFLRALAWCEQPLSLQQCREVCGYLTANGRLQQLSPAGLAELVTLLAPHHAERDSSRASELPSAAQFRQLVAKVCTAALRLLLPAADELSGAEAAALVGSMARMHAVQPLLRLSPAVQAGAARLLSNAAGQLLGAGDTAQLLQHQGVLACAGLVGALDPQAVAALPASARAQVLQLIQQHALQQGRGMPPPDAACLFCAAAGLAASHASADALLPELHGVLAQLLADAQADLASVPAAELVRLARLVAAVRPPLQLGVPQFVAAVQQRLDAMRAGSTPPVDVLAASQQGAGPVELLLAACWLAVDGDGAQQQPRERGDMSLNGLQQLTETPASGVPRGLFEAAAAVLVPSLVERLSSSQVADLMHAFVAAGLFQLLSSAAQAAAWAQLRKQHALLGLTPAQHGALLLVARVTHLAEAVVAEQQQAAGKRGSVFGSAHANSSALLKGVLQASQPNLSAWPPSSVAWALATVGHLLTSTSDWAPASLASVVLEWHAAAAAALQPAVQQHVLPPASCVQLLMGCNRIAMGCSVAADTAPLPPDQDALVQDVLAACVLQLSQPEAQEQLTPVQAVQALFGCSRQPVATRELGTQLLAALQPRLAGMSFDGLSSVPEALARWPAERRPHPTHAWLDSFFAATLSCLVVAAPPPTPGGAEQLRQVPDAASAASAVPPEPLADLAYCLAFLGWLPARGWQEALYTLAAGQLSEFNHDAAANLLQAMAMWRQAARLGRGADGQPICSSGGSSGALEELVVYPAPLVDGLVYMAAAGLKRLGETAALTLPTSLQVLQWPPDEALVGHAVATYAELLSQAQSQRALAAQQVAAAEQAAQQSSKQAAARRLQEKQEQLQMLTQAEQLLERLVAGWQQLLSGGGSPPEAGQQQVVVQEDDEAGQLFTEMLAAAGMQAPGAADEGRAAVDDGALDAEFELLS